ncbi:MAG TPA: helix-turn-helix domain-containing protein [Candidatus Dormibacteraeota bacterium]|nr:helix-turn-helix domain-containing protein [Candidatus Dormibacteraeota bacterium]
MPRLLPVDDAAAHEGVSRTTIYRLIRLGLLKKYRAPGVDRRTYVDADALRQVRAHPPLRVVD